ncbi:MAG: AmmeMemoRadiSam system radical SAM enzyme [Kiritimatiellaeota bacterium]|nr:AmmeMemoRadiSam system radical SAM enzyme [Kiritimatiellota bacterium]
MDVRTGLVRRLDALAGPGALSIPVPGGTEGLVECLACAFHCRIPPGGRGVCRLRFNRSGKLFVPRGYVAGVACDPIEKKPFYHFLPGRDALSYGMLGCNFQCPFCQNWMSSQAVRDSAATAIPEPCTAEQLVALAQRRGAPVISSTYNEPLITSEWSREVFQLAKERGLLTCYVSNGFAGPEVLEYLDPVLDAMNVDLKCFTEAGYRRLGGRLGPVLETIRELHRRGKWVEVITLLVPGFTDGPAEVRAIAEFIVSVSPDIPWHVTAYHADYKMSSGPGRTPRSTLSTAVRIGREAGLRYVYGGNVPGLGNAENTLCPGCGALLLERRGFYLIQNRLRGGLCSECGAVIPGVWDKPVETGRDV